MVLADRVVPLVLWTLRGVCYIALGFYLARAVLLVVVGRDDHKGSGFREAMAMVYTLLAASFIYSSIRAIPTFVENIVDGVSRVLHLPGEMLVFLYAAGGLVFAAFICNCSRSLWVLKSLDHGLFEPVARWEQLSRPMGKRFVEFTTRTVAAGLFIKLEFELKELAKSSPVDEVTRLYQGVYPSYDLSDAGGVGIKLYFVLLLWWGVGRMIAHRQMPTWLLVFYAAGLVNSLFIYKFARPVSSEATTFWLLVLLGIAAIGAGYMVGHVLADVFRHVVPPTWKFFRSHLRWFQSGQLPTT